MKDYNKIKEFSCGKYYLNEKNQYHRLTGPAVEWSDGDKSYLINNIRYLNFIKNSNKIYIYIEILKLTSEYEEYIKQNIKDLIKEYNPEIILYNLEKDQVNQLPDYLKDLIIL